MSQVPVNPPSYDDAVQVKNPNVASMENTTVPPAYPPPQPGQTYASNTGGFDNVLYQPQNQQPLNQPAPKPTNARNTEEGGFTLRQSFGEMNVRRAFVRKVFLILAIQLGITFGFVCLFYFVNSIKLFVQENMGFYIAAYVVFLVMYFVLICFSKAARSHPYNLIMLSCLTLAMSYMVGTITSYYDIEAVMIGLGVTVGVCVTVMLFSIQTRFDFTKCAGLLFVLCMVLFIFGFVTIFTYSYRWYLQVVYGCLGALVFTLFLAFDTQLVMGGRKYELDPEEHIFAALVLYIDVIYIFLFILSIFGGSSR